MQNLHCSCGAIPFRKTGVEENKQRIDLIALRITAERESCAFRAFVAFQTTDLLPALGARYDATTQSHGFSRRLICHT